MKKYLDQLDIESISNLPLPEGDFHIEKKTNKFGDSYWRVRHFLSMDDITVCDREEKLADLEWAGNEVNIESLSRRTPIKNLLSKTLTIAFYWKRILESQYAEIPFDLYLSIDNAKTSFQKKNGVLPSATLRLCAVRGSYHYLDSSKSFADYDQPVLCLCINYPQ
jgi:hypothetical protein